MGKVHFNSNAQQQQLSGTLAGVTYRTDAEGNTFAFMRKHSSIPIIDECIDIIQAQQLANHPDEVQAIASRRKALYMRITRIYNRCKNHPQLRDDHDKLRDAMLLAYRQARWL